MSNSVNEINKMIEQAQKSADELNKIASNGRKILENGLNSVSEKDKPKAEMFRKMSDMVMKRAREGKDFQSIIAEMEKMNDGRNS